MSKDFFKMLEEMGKSGTNPMGAWAETWMTYQQDMAKLWMTTALKAGDAIAPSKDHRFRDDAWNEGIFPLLRHSYELTAKAMVDMADNAGLSDHEQDKLSFYARVAADNMSPSNFLATNPEAQKLAQETGGQSLIDGCQNMLADLEKGYISTTDENAFEVGKNLATTPGSVVFRNDLIELIQYTPMAAKTRKAPILIVPPCVNKFYIFDLNEKKSMVRYLLEQGQSVYMIAWRNPMPESGDKGWDDYVAGGVFEALTAVSDISKSDAVDMMSWCNGGTMLIAALAVMPEDLKAKVGTATFLSSMIDFSDPGQVKVFIDEPQVEAYNQRLKSEKVALGRDIANAMAMLHVNESIWGFVVSNYLMGKAPAPFDVLYWNADTQNLPAKWYSYYVEEMYLANKLMQPGALTICGTPVDTRNIDVPCYFLAADGDHIVPWKTSFTATDLVSGPTEFVLTTGGHVSGTIINHPAKTRRKYWVAGSDNSSAESWQSSATLTDGSWWPHWLEWLDQNNQAERAAPAKTLGNRKYKRLADAPGTYVHEGER
ncbi:polyhydroxyalkanoate synthase [Aliiroseovarius halocynthiae]|uniref:Alpha/beta fold hydrolase n=1 Tax=Aliiroseovarius halocynthiae TaxID=985055 RepID=A0A545SQ67_9RHOB|nr:alpha/beta fold hydrolase [Aliiroseovarius halocynthiae]TQV67125.1 alpha/beta fold hydrolase [Aliiroseovarius halocynthiae]SMR82147.1 polyhydroxyalkanoate synthase [Aliiroseovarius halocynthiae]